MQYNNGTYTENGNVYTGKISSYTQKVARALGDLSRGGANGKYLVDELQNSAEVTQIKRGPNSYTAEGRKNIVRWPPSDGGKALNADGTTKRPSFIGLGHELAHSYDRVIDNQYDESTWYITSNGKAVPRAEIFSTHYENLIRAENNITLRAYYGINVDANDNNQITGGTGQIINPGTRTSTNMTTPIIIPLGPTYPTLFFFHVPFTY